MSFSVFLPVEATIMVIVLVMMILVTVLVTTVMMIKVMEIILIMKTPPGFIMEIMTI